MIRAVDSVGNTGNSSPYTVNIAAGPLTVSPVSLPNGTTARPTIRPSARAGAPDLILSRFRRGRCRRAYAQANTGAISGTPTAGNNLHFHHPGHRQLGGTGNRSYTVGIGSASLLAVSPTSLPNGTTTVAYNQTVSASGGTGPYTICASRRGAAAGLALDANTGAITGMPTAGGTYNFTIQATDTSPNTGSQPIPSTSAPTRLTVSPASLPNGTSNVAYSQTVSASGGTGPYTYAVSSGVAAARGCALDANTGAITGTPTGCGFVQFSIRATIAQQLRHPCLQRQHRHQFADDQSGDVAGVGPGPAVQRDGGCQRRHRPLHLFGVGRRIAAGADAERFERCDQRHDDGGRARISFTISALDMLGNTGSRAYTLTNRPDPALDPEVIGLVNAQVAAARRFASAQIDNLSRHLERLHNFNPCSVDFGVSLPRTERHQGTALSGELALQPVAGQCRAAPTTPNSPAGQVARRMPGSQDCEQRRLDLAGLRPGRWARCSSAR